MLNAHLKRSRRFGLRLLAAVVLATGAAPAAYATDFTETADFGNNPKPDPMTGLGGPTLLGALTPGSNLITGMINTYGDRVGPHGERTMQDQDYVTFIVPAGYALTNFIVSSGTSIVTAPPRNDSLFLGLYQNPYTPVDPSFSSATGLLGWALVTQTDVGSDILPAIGSPILPDGTPRYAGFAVPGATGFTGPLGAGTYTLWLYDGDEAANYSFKLVTAAVPEAATWMMMIAGFGAVGAAMRRRARSAAPLPA